MAVLVEVCVGDVGARSGEAPRDDDAGGTYNIVNLSRFGSGSV